MTLIDEFNCDAKCRDTDVTEMPAGTIMHRSHLPLRKWFVAICLMCQSKKGVSANQIKRMLGVQYKTAWVPLPPHPGGDGQRSLHRPHAGRRRGA